MADIELHKTKSELIVIDEILTFIFKEHNLFLQLGDLCWSSSYGVGRLIDVSFARPDYDEKEKWKYINLHFDFFEKTDNDFYRNYKTDLSDFMRYSSYHKIEAASAEEFRSDVALLANGEMSMDDLLAKKYDTGKNGQSTELISMNKDLLVERKKDLIAQKNFAAARAEAVKNVLERRTSEMRKVSETLGKFIEKLSRLIWSVELYLGIKEELHQLQVGANAPAEDPLCFRQRLLYMDIEVGDPTDDGLDFGNIEDFDEWLLKTNPYWKKKNYELMIPESKCVVIFKVRREGKTYSENPFVNMHINKENFKTYVLLRNGDNIYRIYADIIMGDKLFPDSEQLQSLFETMEKSHWSSDREKAEKEYERYKLNIILFQGIIERTICFPDEQQTINLFNPESYEGKVNFIYDASEHKMLPTGIETFRQWQMNLNADIEEGSRVLYLAKIMGYLKEEDRSYYLFRGDYGRYGRHKNVPDAPKTGVYQVFYDPERKPDYFDKTQKGSLYIKYNPKNTRWVGSYWDGQEIERKNNLAWAIETKENYIINYDAIDRKVLPTLEFYMYTRIGREQYLSYMPTLIELFKLKKEEMKQEDDFIRLALSTAGRDPEADFDKGVEAMEWWKTKNKWKRALNADDNKALRMIVKELKK